MSVRQMKRPPLGRPSLPAPEAARAAYASTLAGLYGKVNQQAQIPHLDKRKTSLEPDAMRAKMFCCTDKPSPTRCTYYEARLTGVPVRRGEEYDGYDSTVGADDVRGVDARSGFEVVGGAPRGSGADAFSAFTSVIRSLARNGGDHSLVNGLCGVFSGAPVPAPSF